MEMQRPPKHSGTAQEALLVRSVAVSRVVRPMFRCSHSSLFHFSIFAVSPRLLLEITCVISILVRVCSFVQESINIIHK
jgi:hypothetical protein